jgi:hypothetical protein
MIHGEPGSEMPEGSEDGLSEVSLQGSIHPEYPGLLSFAEELFCANLYKIGHS